jgi:hypothetical protein
MLLSLTILLLIVTTVGTCWAVTKSTVVIRVLLVLMALLVTSWIGFGVGCGWERKRCYDSHIYWFTEYSRHLRGLVEHKQLNELTNSVVVFDTRFRSHNDDRQVLQDVMYHILKLGPYYQSNSPLAQLPQTNNSKGVRP